MKIKEFKGGSLSCTSLHEEEGKLFVRKETSISKNREYGFQRWYSQLKRIQRYNILFPGLYPKILDFGINGDYAFMDIEYIEAADSGIEFLKKAKTFDEVKLFFNELISVMDKIHETKIKSSKNPIKLYFQEEVKQKISDCKSKLFLEHYKKQKIVFNNIIIDSLSTQLNEYEKMFELFYTNPIETFSHGNLTLENLVYNPNTNKITLIDVYEENIIDSKYADYSQVLQSCNSNYELYNELEDPDLISIPSGIKIFKKLFNEYLINSLSKEELVFTRLLEISQFVRMLPFKEEIAPKKTIFFYNLASYRLHELMGELK